MRVLVTGASGLVGGNVVPRLEQEGHEVVRLVRSPGLVGQNNIYWDPDRGCLSTSSLEGFDGVVHLAGENIASGRWTSERKRRILSSRTRGTFLLSSALAACKHRPQVMISASAIGYYGYCEDVAANEAAPAGQGFLADVCSAWENSTQPASDAGVRVVFLRIGMVLSREGGALARMLPVFKMGLGGPIGNGTAWMSWIAIGDLLRVISRTLAEPGLAGPINAVAPQPVSNKAFVRALSQCLKRPAILPVPPFVLRMLWGEMAQEVLLTSTKAIPERLINLGFEWECPEIAQALAFCLRKQAK